MKITFTDSMAISVTLFVCRITNRRSFLADHTSEINAILKVPVTPVLLDGNRQ